MGEKYNHVNSETRIKIFELLYEGLSISEIANEVGYHRGTIYRELNRNSGEYGYRPDFATQKYWNRIHKKIGNKLSKDSELKEKVIYYLRQGWSPELIAGRLYLQTNSKVISHESIYRYIYSPEGMKLKLYKYLMLKRQFRYPRIKRRRNMVANARKKLIHERAEIVNQRKTFANWEGDLVLFHKTQNNLFTLRERKSRLILAIKNQSRKAKTTTQTLLRYMKGKFDNTVNTLTLDNDVAFAMHDNIAKALNSQIYFCEPYKSYQKGAIENANKLIRTVLPKKTDIKNMAQENIDNIIKKLNDRPMKCLGFKTPNEVFFQAFGENWFLKPSCS